MVGIIEFRRMIDLENLFWIEYNKTWEQFEIEGLNQPGTIVIIDDNERSSYLIGDVNILGGGCDCCKSIRSENIILRYCQLANPYNLSK